MSYQKDLWIQFEQFFTGIFNDDENNKVVEDIVFKIQMVYKKEKPLKIISLETGGGRTEAFLVRELCKLGYKHIELVVVDKIYDKDANLNKRRTLQYLREPLQYVRSVTVFGNYMDLCKWVKKNNPEFQLAISFNFCIDSETITSNYYELMKALLEITKNDGKKDVPLILIDTKNNTLIRNEEYPTLHALGMDILDKYYQSNMNVKRKNKS